MQKYVLIHSSKYGNFPYYFKSKKELTGYYNSDSDNSQLRPILEGLEIDFIETVESISIYPVYETSFEKEF